MKRAFSLVELLVTFGIFLILTTLLLPKAQTLITRARLTQVAADYARMSSALNVYFADHGAFPPTKQRLGWTYDISEVSVLYTPVDYLTPAPKSPWGGMKCPISPTEQILYNEPKPYFLQCDYHLLTIDPSVDESPRFGRRQHLWELQSGGPLCSSVASPSWYQSSNGLLSRGSFYMRSDGKTNLP